MELPFHPFAMPGLGREIAGGKHLPVVVLLLVVDMNHGSQVSREVCRIGCDLQGAGSARGQGLELLKEFARSMITPFSSTKTASAASACSQTFRSPGAMASRSAWSLARTSSVVLSVAWAEVCRANAISSRGMIIGILYVRQEPAPFICETSLKVRVYVRVSSENANAGCRFLADVQYSDDH